MAMLQLMFLALGILPVVADVTCALQMRWPGQLVPKNTQPRGEPTHPTDRAEHERLDDAIWSTPGVHFQQRLGCPVVSDLKDTLLHCNALQVLSKGPSLRLAVSCHAPRCGKPKGELLQGKKTDLNARKGWSKLPDQVGCSDQMFRWTQKVSLVFDAA